MANFRQKFKFKSGEPIKNITGNAEIFCAKDTNGKNICVKKIEKDKHYKQELNIHRSLSAIIDQQYVVKFIDGEVNDEFALIAMEYCKYGSLYNFLEKHYSDGLEYNLPGLADILLSMLLCIGFLHEQKIAHRDIKPDNFLIADDFSLRLCDFGFSKSITNGSESTIQCGTVNYMAPELLYFLEPVYDEKVDVWAFGISAYEMHYGVTPWTCYSNSKAVITSVRALLRGTDFKSSSLYSFIQICTPMEDLLIHCLKPKHQDRLTVKQLLEKNYSPLCYATKNEKNLKNPPITFLQSTINCQK